MSNPSCKTCRWYELKTKCSESGISTYGWCKKHKQLTETSYPGCTYEPREDTVTPERQAELDAMNKDFEALAMRAMRENKGEGDEVH